MKLGGSDKPQCPFVVPLNISHLPGVALLAAERLPACYYHAHTHTHNCPFEALLEAYFTAALSWMNLLFCRSLLIQQDGHLHIPWPG